jgi:ATP synthase I chain
VQTALMLRRIQTTAIVVCAAFAAIAFGLSRGRPGPPVAVLAGGFLVGVSYWLLASGVTAMVDLLMPRTGESSRLATRRSRLAMTAKLAGRYALLALLAYVMIARLRLHPLGLLVGASSVVAAVAIEAVRFLLKKTS